MGQCPGKHVKLFFLFCFVFTSRKAMGMCQGNLYLEEREIHYDWTHFFYILKNALKKLIHIQISVKIQRFIFIFFFKIPNDPEQYPEAQEPLLRRPKCCVSNDQYSKYRSLFQSVLVKISHDWSSSGSVGEVQQHWNHFFYSLNPPPISAHVHKAIPQNQRFG